MAHEAEAEAEERGRATSRCAHRNEFARGGGSGGVESSRSFANVT